MKYFEIKFGTQINLWRAVAIQTIPFYVKIRNWFIYINWRSQ